MKRAFVAVTLFLTAVLVGDVWWNPNYTLMANIAVLVMASLVTVFTCLYGFRSRWKANRIGRIYLTKSVIIAVFLWQVALSVWWDTDYPGRPHVRFVIYTLGGVAYAAMLVSLWREQRRDRKALEDFERIMPMPK